MQECDNSGIPQNIKKHIEWRNSMVHEGVETDDSDNSVYSEPEPSSAPSSSSTAVAISVTISAILIFILLGLVAAFIFVYGRNNPGGIAERIANRLEANYKRFGGPGENDEGQVELGSTKGSKYQNNNNNNNNDINFQEKTAANEFNNSVCF